MKSGSRWACNEVHGSLEAVGGGVTRREMWSSDPQQQLIADAANSIDKLLATSPLEAGESRAAGMRILNVLPLSVYYEVFEQDRRVHVFAVWRVKPR